MIDPEEIVELNRQWQLKVRAGGAVAQQATRDAFRGCSAALAEIAHGLHALNYPAAELITPCNYDLDGVVSKFENATGLEVPLVLVEFWRSVGSVSFIDFKSYAHTRFWAEIGVNAEYCDGLVVYPFEPDWVEYQIKDFAEWQLSENAADDVHQLLNGCGQQSEPYLVALAPDCYHKDNISGGGPYGVFCGEPWLPVFQHFGWTHAPLSALSGPIDFMSYLRTCILECAGFPGLFGDEAFEPVRCSLLANVKGF